MGVDYGEWFDPDENYKGFIRMNLATDPQLVKQAVDNMVNVIRHK
jgi:cystathionine beta-lyase